MRGRCAESAFGPILRSAPCLSPRSLACQRGLPGGDGYQVRDDSRLLHKSLLAVECSIHSTRRPASHERERLIITLSTPGANRTGNASSFHHAPDAIGMHSIVSIQDRYPVTWQLGDPNIARRARLEVSGQANQSNP